MTLPATPLFRRWASGGPYTYCSEEIQLALALHFLIGSTSPADIIEQNYSINTLISMVLSAACAHSDAPLAQ
jgi:hypothetical protein